MRELVVAVSGGTGPATGLVPRDIEVDEGAGWIPAVSLVPASDLPLSVAIVVDASQSMKREFQEELLETMTFLEEGFEKERDSALLVAFKNRPAQLTGPVDAIGRFRGPLSALVPGGGTALYDALVFAALQLQGRPGRRAILAVSDGEDTASRATQAEAVRDLRRLGTPVDFVVPNFRKKLYRMEAMQHLEVLAAATSGRVVYPGSRETFEMAFATIAAHLASQVRVSYPSTGGRVRAVRVATHRRGLSATLVQEQVGPTLR